MIAGSPCNRLLSREITLFTVRLPNSLFVRPLCESPVTCSLFTRSPDLPITSLVPQGHDGINSGGAASRNIAGGESHSR